MILRKEFKATVGPYLADLKKRLSTMAGVRGSAKPDGDLFATADAIHRIYDAALKAAQREHEVIKREMEDGQR